MGDREVEMERLRRSNGLASMEDIDEEIEEEPPLPQRQQGFPGGPHGPQWPPGYSMPVRSPLRVRVNYTAVVVLLLYLATSVFYFYIRITKTLVTGPVFAYGIVVLVIEFLGLSASLPYALLLTLSLLPRGNAKGLPTTEQAANTTTHKAGYNFHVRCLIPCYKESLATIAATMTAALAADLPYGTQRTVYLCDDGNKEDKRLMVEELMRKGHDCEYVTNRPREGKETNGKSNNLNHCLRNVIFPYCQGPDGWRSIPQTEILVVFDADMVANKDFFLRILEPLTNPKYALCLSPQSFRNSPQAADLFNSINLQFWEYWLPGAVAWGYIACTGTNFAIRISPLAHCGWFPTYTITEDYALGMELKMAGYAGTYLAEYLAVGENPEGVRDIMRQRSRWCKGHMQVFFSWAMCPLLQWRLSVPMKLWYSYGTWTYIVNVLSVPTALAIPFLSLAFGLNPVVVNRWFAIAATPYYAAIFGVQSYFRKVDHITGLWFAGVSNTVLAFTYAKAIFNVLLAKGGLKDKGAFKPTPKKEEDIKAELRAPVSRVRSLLRKLSSVRRPTDRGAAYDSLDPGSSDSPSGVHQFPASPLPPTPGTPGVSVLGDHPAGPVHVTVVVNQAHEAEPLIPAPAPPPKQRAPWPKRLASVFSPKNLENTGGVLDPTALCIMLAFCLAVIGMGLWRIFTSPAGGRGARYLTVSPYIGLPMFWSVYNAIPPFLFVVYCFTSGKPFVRIAAWMRLLGTLTVIGAVFLLWLTVPVEFDMARASALAANYVTRQSAVAAALGDTADLGGGVTQPLSAGWLIGGDPVRYGMPLATGASLLAWSLIQFPDGFKRTGTYTQSVQDVVAAATYILGNWDPDNKVFIAQVGDPLAYITVRESLQAGNSSWTAYSEDPLLARPRPAFVLNSTHVGADLLAESAAALGLASLVVQRSGGDPAQAAAFRDGAVSLYALATSTKDAEQSYCDFVPCAACVATKKMVTVVPLPASKSLDPPGIKCWLPDYPRATCTLVTSEADCLDAARSGPVYSRRSSCCAQLRSAGVWANQTTPQGACALPEGQFECWVPDLQLRTCAPSSINTTTGDGCTGPGLDFFPAPQSCCAQLVKAQAITGATPGQGVCAKGPPTCFVPDLINRTCRQLTTNDTTGDQCATLGASEQYATVGACCGSLVAAGAISNQSPGTGLCATPEAECFVVDLTGKRCISLPNATATAATCADFASDFKGVDRVSCCNKLFTAVGGIGPFFDESCRPAPTPPPPTTTPTPTPAVTPKATPAATLAKPVATLAAPVATLAEPVATEAAPVATEAAPAATLPARRRLQQEEQRHGADAPLVLWGQGSASARNTLGPHERAQPAGGQARPTLEAGGGPLDGLEAGATGAPGAGPSRRLLQAQFPPFLNVPASAIAAEETRLVDVDVAVRFYPSSSVLDDLAWAGAALFLATNDAQYLGDAQAYLALHQSREARGRQLGASAEYYVYNYDSVGWAAAALLAQLTDLKPYHDHVRTFLRAWVQLEPPRLDPDLLAQRQAASRVARQQNLITEHLVEFTAADGVAGTYLVLDGCIPDRNNTPAAQRLAAALAANRTATGPVVLGDPLAVTFEQDCTDGRDNDCDGRTDMDDPDCPFFPVQATNLALAWTKDAPLPHAAAASYLALLYSTLPGLSSGQRRSLRCWALGQVRYMMGDNQQPPDSRSFIVGYDANNGYKSPTRVPDRPSSCPANQLCTFENALYPGLPNPRLDLIAGALVAGPNLDDSFVDDRLSNGTRIGADLNVAFLAAMAGIFATDTDVKTCGQLSGVYEDVFGDTKI